VIHLLLKTFRFHRQNILFNFTKQTQLEPEFETICDISAINCDYFEILFDYNVLVKDDNLQLPVLREYRLNYLYQMGIELVH
jgi:hypothetical protein